MNSSYTFCHYVKYSTRIPGYPVLESYITRCRALQASLSIKTKITHSRNKLLNFNYLTFVKTSMFILSNSRINIFTFYVIIQYHFILMLTPTVLDPPKRFNHLTLIFAISVWFIKIEEGF